MSCFKTGDIVVLTSDRFCRAKRGATAVVNNNNGTQVISICWIEDNPLHNGQDGGNYTVSHFKLSPQIMEIGKTYTSNASCVNRKVVCIAHDKGKCVIRSLKPHKYYECVVGQIGKGMHNWTEYHKPVVSIRYTSVATSQWAGDHDVWCISKEPHHNIKGTFHDTLLVSIESML